MKKLLFPLTLCAAAVAAPVMADTYQSEVSAGYSDHTDASNADVWGLGAKVFLMPVDTDNGPYELNSFLSHASYLQGGMAFNDNLDQYLLGGRLVTSTDMVLDVQYKGLDFDHGEDADQYSVALGGYVNQSSLVSLYYKGLDWGRNDANTWGARVKSYMPLVADSGLLLKTDLSNSNVDHATDVFAWDISGDYFFNKQLSAGLGMDYINASNDQVAYVVQGHHDTTYYANASYWFNPRANVSVGVNKTRGDNGMGWMVKGAYRF
ncbi:putative porin [Gallaecimonas mangrovi]|uniref:putative porin n=1 Tax=Gallaecimonas mangrovi TaxID=2291597 RepID=UPI001866B072|nr:putative porin [Gallaecimonas mangrovi]